MPILISLIDGKRSAFSFTDDERLVLARWAAKTAYALNSSSNLKDNVNPSHLRELAADPTRLPSGVAVFIQQHGLEEKHTRHFSWIQQNHWRYVPLVPPRSGEENKGKSGYKIGLQFGRLILLVVFWPHAGWRFLLGSGMHVMLWPSEPTLLAYTINETVPVNDSFLWLMAFNQLLAVAQMPELPSGWRVIQHSPEGEDRFCASEFRPPKTLGIHGRYRHPPVDIAAYLNANRSIRPTLR